MTTLLKELRTMGRRVEETVFVCSGDAPLGATGVVQVFYKGGPSAFGCVSFPPTTTTIEQLFRACAPATFGKGSEEVLDKTYRDAVALDTGKFMTSFQLSEHPQILSEIQSILASSSGDSLVVARLYKLNVYGAGGFFKAHRDTPRGDARLFGTLVACLPSRFEGGDFVVKNHDGFAQVFNWSDKSSASNSVQWCAFYSDCEHEVLPVTNGHRVTLTYLLESQPNLKPSGRNIARTVSSMEMKLRAAMEDSSFAPYGAKLGFGLKHAYVVTENGAMPMLKGPDRALKDTLDHLGLSYACVPVYAGENYSAQYFQRAQDAGQRGGDIEPSPYGYEDDEEYYDMSRQAPEFELEGLEEPPPLDHEDVFYMGDGSTNLLVGSWRAFNIPIDLAPNEEYTHHCLDFENLDLHTTKEVLWIAPPVQFPMEKHGANYGNEPTMSSYYAAASFIVWMPSWTKRSQEAARATYTGARATATAAVAKKEKTRGDGTSE